MKVMDFVKWEGQLALVVEVPDDVFCKIQTELGVRDVAQCTVAPIQNDFPEDVPSDESGAPTNNTQV